MQEASKATEATPRPSRSLVSPVKALILVVAISLISGIVLIAQSPSPGRPTESQTDGSAASSPTQAEALEVFRRIQALRHDVFRSRDSAALGELYTPDSPALVLAKRQIKRLQSKDVIDQSVYTTVSVDFTSISADEISLEERTTVKPRFTSESGEDVTVDRGRIRQVVNWTLRRDERGRWRVYDAVLESSRKV